MLCKLISACLTIISCLSSATDGFLRLTGRSGRDILSELCCHSMETLTLDRFFKAFVRRLGTNLDAIPKPRTVDIEAKLVYGGDLPQGISTPTESFGSILFNRMMRPERRNDIFQVDSLTNDSMTTAQCLENAVAVAERFQEEGVKKGDFILLLGNNSLNMNIALLGVFFLGAVPLPISYKANFEEFELIVESIKPKYFGCDRNHLYSLKKVLSKTSLSETSKVFLLDRKRTDSREPDVEGFENFIEGRGKNFESFQPAKVSDPKNELVLLMKALREGTIGKVVGITHHNINSVVARYDSKNLRLNFSEKIILMVQKVMWMSGIYTLILSSCYGSKLIVMSEFDEEKFLKAIHDHKVTTTFLYSSKCWQIYKHIPRGVYDLSSFKQVIAIDGSLPNFLMDGLKEKIGVTPQPSYGMAEFTGLILEPYHDKKEGSTGKLVAQAYGKVISHETFKNVGPNKKGELCFKGPTLTKGYINDAKSTKNLIDKEGFLLSGHYGYYDEEGNFYIIDKIIYQIKYKDYKISPKELEGIVKSLDAVKDVCVTGLPHPTDGELPIAFVSLEKGQKISEKEILDYVNGKVPEYKYLRAAIFLPKIPRFRDSGEIKRNIFKKILSKYRMKTDGVIENGEELKPCETKRWEKGFFKIKFKV